MILILLIGLLLTATAVVLVARSFMVARLRTTGTLGSIGRYGFAGVGLRRGYYQPSGADALVMRRETEPVRPLRGRRRRRLGGAA